MTDMDALINPLNAQFFVMEKNNTKIVNNVTMDEIMLINVFLAEVAQLCSHRADRRCEQTVGRDSSGVPFTLCLRYTCTVVMVD
ncbi:hypothetical protein [Acetobacter sp.]|jgi:hypothetical protein|uniref:hypothetical protein n=1 Tax=Acetobacter sp. TaxID=440 RepID=UPI0025BA9856|nr:hypothetical protein [Acetobacter sp.]MCH4092326.1 hypothetical protein [Acetobacter sp.]MCI1300998.1 hypothetical protein [Acetobacter sp.]MCI1317230.1 hypothetical protein [Acetobacter sp.]